MLDSHRLYRFAAPALILFAVLAAALPASAGAGAEEELSERDIEARWKQHWRNYARRTVKLGDQFYVCAAYETQYPSSLGTTFALLRAKTTTEVTERSGLNVRTRRLLVRPGDDLLAAVEGLPAMRVGEYGKLHSGEVLAVLGPDELVIGDAWLLDAEATRKAYEAEEQKLTNAGLERGDLRTVLEWLYFDRLKQAELQRSRDFRQPVKIVGVATTGVSVGGRWRGPEGKGIELAIVTTYTPEPARPAAGRSSRASRTSRTRQVLLAIPAVKFRTSAVDSEAVFLEYLASRKYDKATFIKLFIEEQKGNPKDDRLRDARIFARLEGWLEEQEAAGEEQK